MTPQPVRLLIAGLMALPLLTLSACDDAEAAAQVAASQAIQASADEAFLAGNDSAKLKQVVRSLQAVKDGDAQQMSTRDRLLASVQLQLAILKMGRLEAMELAVRHDLLRLRSMADAAARMSTFAASRESLSLPDVTQGLAQRREQIRSQIEQMRQQASQLDGPLQATVAALEASAEDVLRLNRQAKRLREEAGVEGPLKRFPLIEQAIDLERQADRIEADMMRKELSLELFYRPNKANFDRSQVDLADMIAEIDDAHGSLQQSARQTADAASRARTSLQDMDERITTLSRSVSDRIADDLRPGYDDASRDLQSAAGNARKGGRGIQGRPGKQENTLLRARIELAQADLAAMQTRGLNEWLGMLELLSTNDDLGNRDAWMLQAEEVRGRRNELATKGIESIDAAIQSIEGSSAADVTKASLNSVKAFLSGDQMPAPDAETASQDAVETAGSSPFAPDDGGTDGFESPDDLINATRQAFSSGNFDTIGAFMIASTLYPTAEDRANAQANVDLVKGLAEVQKLAQGFGGSVSGMAKVIASNPQMASMMASMTFTTPAISGDEASLTASIMGMDQPLKMRKTASGWKWSSSESIATDLPDAHGINLKVQQVLSQLRDGSITDQAQLDAAMASVYSALTAATQKVVEEEMGNLDLSDFDF